MIKWIKKVGIVFICIIALLFGSVYIYSQHIPTKIKIIKLMEAKYPGIEFSVIKIGNNWLFGSGNYFSGYLKAKVNNETINTNVSYEKGSNVVVDILVYDKVRTEAATEIQNLLKSKGYDVGVGFSNFSINGMDGYKSAPISLTFNKNMGFDAGALIVFKKRVSKQDFASMAQKVVQIIESSDFDATIREYEFISFNENILPDENNLLNADNVQPNKIDYYLEISKGVWRDKLSNEDISNLSMEELINKITTEDLISKIETTWIHNNANCGYIVY